MATVLNYTPHNPLRFFVDGDEAASLPAAGPAIRLTESSAPAGRIRVDGHDIPVVTMGYGTSDDLPDPRPGTVLVVSQLVCRAYPDRDDLVFPIDLVRNGSGDVVGCRGVARLVAAS